MLKLLASTLSCTVVVLAACPAHGADDVWALALQRQLADDTPLTRTQWLGAHNAWNDSNAVWANQRWPMDRLLDEGIRAVDLDLHRDKSGAIRLCHEDCSAIYGASDDYENELRKVQTFAATHPRDVFYVDLEDRVGDARGVIDPLQRVFGSALYLPGDLPASGFESPRAMVARGKRIIVKSANNTYDGSVIWDGRRFSINAEPGWNYRQVKYFDVAKCTTDGAPLTRGLFYGVMDSKLGKEILPDSWVDDTGTIDGGNIPGLLQCGLSFVDADRWDEAMLRSAVWSWGDGEPNNAGGDEDCAMLNDRGRWNDLQCGQSLAFACQSARDPDAFFVTGRRGPFADGPAACAAEEAGAQFSVPQNAYQNARLVTAAGGRNVWLALSDQGVEGRWETGLAARSRADLTDATTTTLRLPWVAAVRVSLAGTLPAGQRLRVYDLDRRLVRELSGNVTGVVELPENGGFLERTGAGAAVTASLEARSVQTPLAYKLVRNDNGKCLDLKNRSTAEGTVVHQWRCHGADSQRWAMDERGLVHSKMDPNMCLTLAEDSAEKSVRVVLGTCDGGVRQRFLVGPRGTLRPQLNEQRTLDIKDAAWGVFDGQVAHLWDVHYGNSQRWTWE